VSALAVPLVGGVRINGSCSEEDESWPDAVRGACQPAERLERHSGISSASSDLGPNTESRDLSSLIRDVNEALRDLTKGANSIGAAALADVREAGTAVSL
jgi:hypothetical protein